MTLKHKVGALLFGFLVATPAIVVAQPIHQHPQKAAYASPAEWPTTSGQCHWVAGPETSADHPAHTHVDETSPIYAAVREGDTFTVPFAVKLFHVAGRITEVRPSALIEQVIWDATGSTQLPDLTGDPHGLKAWTGHLTLAFTHLDTDHGWIGTQLAVATLFDNGDRTLTKLLQPYFVVTDPTVAETWGIKIVSTRCESFAVAHPDIVWGVTLAEYDDYIPVAPIQTPWVTRFSSAGYGGSNLGPVSFEQRADLDLHNNIPGTLLARIDSQGDISTTVTFNPAVLGSGPHKMAVLRNQPQVTGEQITALTVIDVVVGPGVPPPVCVPPMVVTMDGRCVVLPPVDTWNTFTGLIQEFGLTTRLRVCPVPAAGTAIDQTKCIELVVK